MEKKFWTYILASKSYGTLYVGVTSNLIKRVAEHKNGIVEGFTKKYDVNNLVYYEEHATAENAIRAEKRLEKYNRDWKINLIERDNPYWQDLYDGICK